MSQSFRSQRPPESHPLRVHEIQQQAPFYRVTPRKRSLVVTHHLFILRNVTFLREKKLILIDRKFSLLIAPPPQGLSPFKKIPKIIGI